MPVPFVDLQAQYRSIKAEVDAAIQRVFDTSAFILGREVEAFERAFAGYVGARECVGVSNGTAAIQLALQACGVGPGDEVIVPANAFFATAEAVSTASATPVFVDCDPVTCNIDAGKIEAAVTQRTRAVIPVHLQPAYAALGHKEGDFPNAESQSARVLSLPMFAELTEHQLRYVADALQDFHAESSAAAG